MVWMLHVKPEPVSDFARYYELARDLAHHHQFGYPEPTAYRLPFYPAFLSSFVALGADATVLSVVNVILCGIAATLLFLLVRALGMGLTCATAAGLPCALNPVFVFFSPVLASEHLFAVLLLLALLVAVRPTRRPVRAALGTGILGGLAALTRGEALFFLPVWLLALHLYQSRSKLQTAKLALALLMATAVVLFPWRLRNRLVIGPGVGLSTTAATNLYMAHNPGKYGYQPLDTTPLGGMDSSTRQKTAYRLVVGYLREDPRNLLADVVKGTKALFARSGYAVRWSTKTVSAGKYTTRQVTGRFLFLLAERLIQAACGRRPVPPATQSLQHMRLLAVPERRLGRRQPGHRHPVG